MAEFDLIGRIRARAGRRDDVVLGIGDDAAVLDLPHGRQLVIAMDTLNAGVHFPHDTAACDIGWKALAVNLSDLAAMGAQPAWCTLSLSLPDADAHWVDGFIDGFQALAGAHDVVLVGGDTTRGPLSVCVTVHGFIEPGGALQRNAARVGDDIWVSGTLGDAAGALSLLSQPSVATATDRAGVAHAAGDSDRLAAAALRGRLDRPTPRLALGRALVGVARAAIDISDGLFADLGHVVRCSGVGACIEIDSLPASIALRQRFGRDERRAFQAGGGDDYEICFTAPADTSARVIAASQSAATPVTRIGRIVSEPGVHAVEASGMAWQPARRGFEHFG